jgi:hypothetical protein
VDIRGTALVVEVDHPGWSQMVILSRERILTELERRFPELTITGLHVRVAGDRATHGLASARSAQNTNARPGPGKNASAGGPASAGTAPGNAAAALGPAKPGARQSAPLPPSEDEAEALGRIDDDDLRDSLERLRESLDEDASDDS